QEQGCRPPRYAAEGLVSRLYSPVRPRDGADLVRLGRKDVVTDPKLIQEEQGVLLGHAQAELLRQRQELCQLNQQCEAITRERDRLRDMLQRIQEMATEDLRQGQYTDSLMWQIEADARNALGGQTS